MGYGLFSTMQLISNAGSLLQIHSGRSVLSFDGNNIQVSEASPWQVTIVYFELHSDKVIDPKQVLGGKADPESDYDQLFEIDDNMDELW